MTIEMLQSCSEIWASRGELLRIIAKFCKVLYERKSFPFEGEILIDFLIKFAHVNFSAWLFVLCPTCDKKIMPKRYYLSPLVTRFSQKKLILCESLGEKSELLRSPKEGINIILPVGL